MRKKISDYRADLLDDLRNDFGYAAKYISAAYADSQEAFLVALRDVVEATSGVAKVAEGAGVNRENLYRTLSKEGNPRLSTLGSVLNALGMELSVRPRKGVFNTTPLRGTLAGPSQTLIVGSTGISSIAQPISRKPSGYIDVNPIVDDVPLDLENDAPMDVQLTVKATPGNFAVAA